VAQATPERGSSVADATPFVAYRMPGVETPSYGQWVAPRPIRNGKLQSPSLTGMVCKHSPIGHLIGGTSFPLVFTEIFSGH